MTIQTHGIGWHIKIKKRTTDITPARLIAINHSEIIIENRYICGMSSSAYIQYRSEQIHKIGNAVVYLSQHIPQLSKTKLLKLLYILDEVSIKKSGLPLLNLKYKVWKFGPVSEELFIDLSSEPTILKNYIKREHNNEHGVIVPVAEFDDAEFSDNDMEILDIVIKQFGNKTSKELVAYTHRKNAPWYITAQKHSVLELLENETINNTEYLVDLSILVAHDDRKKQVFEQFELAN
jgi:uncharacterized phage-associated protein